MVSGSRNVRPDWNASFSFFASLTTSFPIDTPPPLPRSMQSRITCRRRFNARRMSAAGMPCSCSSDSRKTSAWTRSLPSSASCLKDSIMRVRQRVAALRYSIEILRLGHVGRRADTVERALAERRVDVDLHERVFPALFARAVERRDVDPFLGDDARHLRDHARPVAVEEEQRRRVAFEARLEAVDVEALDHAAADRRA